MLKQAAITVKASIPFALREAVRALQPQLTKTRSTAVRPDKAAKSRIVGRRTRLLVGQVHGGRPGHMRRSHARTRDGGVAGYPTVLGHPAVPSTVSNPLLARLANRFPCGGVAHPRSANVYIGTVVAEGSKVIILPRLTGSLRSSIAGRCSRRVRRPLESVGSGEDSGLSRPAADEVFALLALEG